jgi:hypothetical protein
VRGTALNLLGKILLSGCNLDGAGLLILTIAMSASQDEEHDAVSFRTIVDGSTLANPDPADGTHLLEIDPGQQQGCVVFRADRVLQRIFARCGSARRAVTG